MKFLRAIPMIATLGVALAQSPGPKIAITKVPPSDPGGPDSMETISGTVTGECPDCTVILFARGDAFYVQPFANQTATPIVDGKWTNDTHLGTEYAAVLVRAGYQPPSKTAALPKVGGLVLDVARVSGKK